MTKMGKIILKLGCPLIAICLAGSAHATGTVTMTLSDYSTYAEYNPSFTAYYGSQQIVNAAGNDIIGLYSFDVAPGSNPSLSTPFWTACLSPDGILDTASHTYDYDTFPQAQPGLNPAYWAGANNTDGGVGVQNASYLFSQLSGTILSGGNPSQSGTSLQDQGAALALAIWDALYNSTGYGAINGTVFTIPGLQTGDPNVYNDYVSDVGVVNGAKVSSTTGYALVPDPVGSGSGQDMILLGTGLPQGGTPVPETTTIISGLLLLLPFGATTLRILRKRQAA